MLPIGDGKITQLPIDYAFTLLLQSWIAIRIETPFTYGPEGGARWFEPSDSPGLAPLLSLHQATVTSLEIRKDGRLTLAFAGGAVLTVLPDERYEAFTVLSWVGEAVHRGPAGLGRCRAAAGRSCSRRAGRSHFPLFEQRELSAKSFPEAA